MNKNTARSLCAASNLADLLELSGDGRGGHVDVCIRAAGLYLSFTNRLQKRRWFMLVLIAAIILPYLANSTGWILTEVGRQPVDCLWLDADRSGYFAQRDACHAADFPDRFHIGLWRADGGGYLSAAEVRPRRSR